MKDRRILFISPRQCWPPMSGAKLREYHFLRALSQNSRLTYLYFAESEQTETMRDHLAFCERIVAVAKPETYSSWNLIRGATGRWPVPVLNYTSAGMASALSALHGSYDLVHLDSIHMTRYHGLLQEKGSVTKFVYSWHNIESERMLRHAVTVRSKLRRLYAKLTAHKLDRLEKEILKTAFGHIVCSERERESLARISPAARITTVENGVDSEYFQAAEKPRAPGRDLVFVGKMDYYPNVEAAKGFVERIWPAIRRRLPGATLTIAGSDPVDAVKALSRTAGVTVTGTVADLRPYYHNALAAVVPLRTGGGTRLKILEAMAAGVPVISTEVGAEGLKLQPGQDFFLARADDPEEWLSHLRCLAENPEERSRIARRGVELARSRYDWKIVCDRLLNTYDEWLNHAA